MTFAEAAYLKCLECKKTLAWNGFKGYEYEARCCNYLYLLAPKVAEYALTISKTKSDPPAFWHPI